MEGRVVIRSDSFACDSFACNDHCSVQLMKTHEHSRRSHLPSLSGRSSRTSSSHRPISGHDTQLLLWDIEMDEIVVPLRRAPSGSPTYSTGNQSAHWDSACPVGTLQTTPSTRDVPKISPLVAHRVHSEPLSGLVFTQESVLTVCREGHIKIWMRPGFSENQSNSSDSALSTSLKEKSLLSGKVGSSSYKP